MDRNLVDILVCPDDKAPLELTVRKDADGQVLEGTLTCTRCGFAYPIEEGVPNLLPQALHTDGVIDAHD